MYWRWACMAHLCHVGLGMSFQSWSVSRGSTGLIPYCVLLSLTERIRSDLVIGNSVGTFTCFVESRTIFLTRPHAWKGCYVMLAVDQHRTFVENSLCREIVMGLSPGCVQYVNATEAMRHYVSVVAFSNDLWMLIIHTCHSMFYLCKNRFRLWIVI